jgi:hypothetical protein
MSSNIPEVELMIGWVTIVPFTLSVDIRVELVVEDLYRKKEEEEEFAREEWSNVSGTSESLETGCQRWSQPWKQPAPELLSDARRDRDFLARLVPIEVVQRNATTQSHSDVDGSVAARRQ